MSALAPRVHRTASCYPPFMSVPATAELIAAVPVVLPPGWSYPAHRHDDFCQMLVISRGEATATVGGTTVTAKAGQSLLYPAGVMHAELNTARGATDAVYLGFTITRDLSGAAPRGDLPTGRLLTLARWLCDVPARSELAGHLLSAALSAHTTTSPRAESGLVRDVREYASTRLGDPPTLAELAARAGLSTFHFARRFRTAAGVPPAAYLRRLRLDAAHALLATTSLPIDTVAQRTGFSDGFALSKALHRETGLRPSHVRRPHTG